MLARNIRSFLALFWKSVVWSFWPSLKMGTALGSGVWLVLGFFLARKIAKESGWFEMTISDGYEGAVLALGAFFFLFLIRLLAAPYVLWRRECEARALAETRIAELQASADKRTEKRRLLDEISDGYLEMVNLRIDMESAPNGLSAADWDKKLGELQKGIAAKIEEFSSRAEARAYLTVGNLPRPMIAPGQFARPLHLDICIHDIDYLKKFIADHRCKELSL